MNRPASLRRLAGPAALVAVTCPLAACGGGGSTSSWVGTFCGSGSSLRTVLSGTNDAIKATLKLTDLPPVDLKQGKEIEAAAVAAYAGFDERAKALQTEAGALAASSPAALADGIGPYSQHVADLSRDVAGSFAGLRSFEGYAELRKASTAPDEYGTADSCRDLQTVAS